MKHSLRFFLVFNLVISFHLSGQKNSILLIEKYNSSKTKKLSLDRVYTIKTSTTKFHREKIIAVTDSSIRIIQRVITNDSLMNITKYSNPNANDTTYYRKYRKDTLDISFHKIISLERDLLKHAAWVEPFLWLSFAGIGAVALTPLVALANGPEEGIESLKIGGAILGVTLPIIYLAERTISYDMKNKWTFSKANATNH